MPDTCIKHSRAKNKTKNEKKKKARKKAKEKEWLTRIRLGIEEVVGWYVSNNNQRKRERDNCI